MTDLTPREKEMLAALKAAQRDLLECGRQNNAITEAICQCEPPSRLSTLMGHDCELCAPHLFWCESCKRHNLVKEPCEHYLEKIAPASKPKPPKPRRWVVECVYQGRDESPIQERHNYISNIIREVKPITRAQLNDLCYAHDSAGDTGMLHELHLLGIEVED